jgi:hypothetical protein
MDDDCVDVPAAPDYDPTVCFSLSNLSALPKQCIAPTWSLDPPCPKCWTNDAPEYVPGTSPTTLTNELKAALQSQLPEYLDLMQRQRPPSHADDGTIFSGIGARALLYLKLHEATGDPKFLAQASPYVDAMAAKIEAAAMAARLRAEAESSFDSSAKDASAPSMASIMAPGWAREVDRWSDRTATSKRDSLAGSISRRRMERSARRAGVGTVTPSRTPTPNSSDQMRARADSADSGET